MAKKPGVNAPCPCGSGKKYKKCHGSPKGNRGLVVYTISSEEGTADPFIARMWVQIAEIRDIALSDKKQRDEFDEVYEPALQNLREARYAKQRFIDLVTEYEEKVNSGQCVENDEGGNVRITETIDLEANLLYKDFYIRGRMALDNILAVAKFFGIDLGFIYDGERKFQDGLRRLPAAGGNTDSLRFWCGMIEETRGDWLTKLVNIRNDIEHKGFTLPKFVCDLSSGTLKLHVIKVAGTGQDIREAIENFWQGLFHFSELLLVYLLSTSLPKGLGVISIPTRNRDPNCPMAFRVCREPKVAVKPPETWEEFKKSAEEAEEETKPPTCALRIKDENSKQVALFDYYAKEKGGVICSASGMPLEMFLLILKGKSAALSVKGTAGAIQFAEVKDLGEEEFRSWAPRIKEISKNTLFGELVER